MFQAIQTFDESILLFVQENLRSDFLTPIMLFITKLGDVGFIWLLIGVVLLISKKTRRVGVVFLICLALAFVVNNLVIKPLVARPRPYTVIPELQNLLTETSYAFPSGHTNASFAAAMMLTLVYGKKGAWSYVLAGLIAFSRVYIGVHYLSDVLAGMLVGTACSLLVYFLIGKLVLRKNR